MLHPHIFILIFLIKNRIVVPRLCHIHDSVFDRYIYHPQNAVNQALPITELFQLTRVEHGFSVDRLNYLDSFQCLIKSGLICGSMSQEWILCASSFAKKGVIEVKFSNFSELIEYFL